MEDLYVGVGQNETGLIHLSAPFFSSDGPASSNKTQYSITSAASHTATSASAAAASRRIASASSSASLFALSSCDSESLAAFSF